MDIDTPFKIEFLTIKTNNFKEKKKLIKRELKKYPEKRLENFYSNRDNNKISSALLKIFKEEDIGTQLITEKSTLPSRKLWISSFGSVAGTIVIDDGASEALLSKGKSLLSVGITEVLGNFNKGDLVNCIDKDGKEIATGLSNFNNKEIEAIKGLNTDEILKVLGYLTQEEVIHRNNLVLS
jgi:glutamate 5-kinase